jgi:uncharacterized protein YceK
MQKQLKNILIIIAVVTFLSGCGVGSVVALPFKAAGAVVNVVTPDVVGDTISGVGDVADAAIPF